MLKETEGPIAENEFRKTLAQVLGGLLLLIGLFGSLGQLQLAQQDIAETAERGRKQLALLEARQATDRFSEAVSHLGSTNTTMRLGGIYLLERIARDSTEDFPAVLRLLNTYVRENAIDSDEILEMDFDTEVLLPDRDQLDDAFGRLGPDFSAAVQAIGRLSRVDNRPSLDLDFSHLFLTNVEFEHADLEEMRAYGTLFCGGDFRNAVLDGADLRSSGVVLADFEGAKLSGVNLRGAQLILVNLRHATLDGVDLTRATVGADLTGANLETAKGLDFADLEGSCSDGGTYLPTGSPSLRDCESYNARDHGPKTCMEFWPSLWG